jgi:HlyD family secretion protein
VTKETIYLYFSGRLEENYTNVSRGDGRGHCPDCIAGSIGGVKHWLILMGCAMILGCESGPTGTLHVTGQIEGVAVSAGSKIGGRVAEVLVREGDAVKSGQVLVRLDDADAQAVVAAAKAKLAGTEAMLAKLEAGATPEQLRQAEAAAKAAEEQYRMAERGARGEEIRAAAAAVDGARAQRDNAERDFQRIERLYAEQAVSQRQFDQARAMYDAASAQHRAAAEQHAMAVKGAREEEVGMAKAAFERAQAALDEVRKGAREEDLASARAARDAAAADVLRAETAAGEMVITAPLDGVVESIDIHPGDLIQPGPVVKIVNPEDLELMIYVGAAMLGQLRLGEQVTLTTDSHGAETFQGEITYIAAQGEFTPRNLQTQEERVQQVFGVKLRLDSAGGKLRAGMTVTAHLPKHQGTS